MEDMATTASELQSLDVLVVGAGISGIGAAYYLQRDHPQRSYAILEARNASGGTWSSGDGRWTVTTEDADTGERSTLTCQWLLSASGYYRYDGGFTPYFEGRERFGGRVVHPQNWPEDLDYEGKRVIVIARARPPSRSSRRWPARQGSRAPWRISPTYNADVKLLRRGSVDDPELRFERVTVPVP